MDVILREDAAPQADTARLRIKHYIMQNLRDTTFNAAGIALAVNLSTGHVHRLFADEDMSVTRFVWSRRLDAAREMLTAPRCRNLRIETIAWRRGFISQAHFSRMFKKRFDLTPRQIRATD